MHLEIYYPNKPAGRLKTAIAALLATFSLLFLSAPVGADPMELQRCVWRCLSSSDGADDPAYHRCVDQACSAGDDDSANNDASRRDSTNQSQADRQRVVTVQRRLAELGYRPGRADGILGRKTRAAIRKFLTDRGEEPRGYIDERLMNLLSTAR